MATTVKHCRDCKHKQEVQIDKSEIRELDGVVAMADDGDVVRSTDSGRYNYCARGFWDGLASPGLLDSTVGRPGAGGIFLEHGDLCSDWSPGPGIDCCSFCEEKNVVEVLNGARYCLEHIMKFRKEAAERRKDDKQRTQARKDERRSKEQDREESRFNAPVREVLEG